MDHKGSILIYILLGIIILVIFGGIYLVIFKNKINLLNPPQACTMEAKICPDGSAVGRAGPSCEFTPCPIDMATDSANVADWRIYKSTRYFYQVSYPPAWKYESYNDDATIYFSDPNKVLPPDTYPSSLDMSINVLASKGTLNDYMEEINSSIGLKNKEIYQKTGETIIDGKSAIVTFGGCCGDTGKHVFVKNLKYIYDIESIGEKESPFFNQFLSTFKFL